MKTLYAEMYVIQLECRHLSYGQLIILYGKQPKLLNTAAPNEWNAQHEQYAWEYLLLLRFNCISKLNIVQCSAWMKMKEKDALLVHIFALQL